MNDNNKLTVSTFKCILYIMFIIVIVFGCGVGIGYRTGQCDALDGKQLYTKTTNTAYTVIYRYK